MKNADLNHSHEHKKVLKSRNSGKIEEFDTKTHKFTNVYTITKEKKVNKTFYNTSHDQDILLTDIKANIIKKPLHTKTKSNNYLKLLKFSPPKKGLRHERETPNSINKSGNSNDFLKNAKCVLKNNKSINHILKKVEARSNNISPINSSFSGLKKALKKQETKSNFYHKNEFESEKNSILTLISCLQNLKESYYP